MSRSRSKAAAGLSAIPRSARRRLRNDGVLPNDGIAIRRPVRRMRAFVIAGPGEAGVVDVPDPVATPGDAVVRVLRAGVCGTDVEFFSGEMAYLHDGQATF